MSSLTHLQCKLSYTTEVRAGVLEEVGPPLPALESPACTYWLNSAESQLGPW